MMAEVSEKEQCGKKIDDKLDTIIHILVEIMELKIQRIKEDETRLFLSKNTIRDMKEKLENCM